MNISESTKSKEFDAADLPIPLHPCNQQFLLLQNWTVPLLETCVSNFEDAEYIVKSERRAGLDSLEVIAAQLEKLAPDLTIFAPSDCEHIISTRNRVKKLHKIKLLEMQDQMQPAGSEKIHFKGLSIFRRDPGRHPPIR